jgi:hypothetical protein
VEYEHVDEAVANGLFVFHHQNVNSSFHQTLRLSVQRYLIRVRM